MAVSHPAAFLCYVGKLELVPGKVVPLFRIFLCYGHGSNEEIVLRIKSELEKRGHDVWIDKSEIKFADDWRRSIIASQFCE